MTTGCGLNSFHNINDTATCVTSPNSL